MINYKMDFDAPAWIWMASPLRWPAVTLTFDVQNLTMSSAGTSGYCG